MNVSFSTRGWQQIPWEQQVQMAETMRFGGIELYNVHKTPELTGRGGPLHRYTAAATARELWQKGLCIPCFDTACDIAGEDCTETVTALVQLAHDVQCPYVSVTAQRDDDARISAALEALLPAAEAQGITILLKTSGVFSDTARLRTLLDAFACDQLGALWDMHHPYRDHGESADTTIKNLGAYVRHVHLRDSDDDGSYDLIGEGTLPVGSMMQALSSIDYDGFISLEWKPEWMPDLTDPEVIFPHFVNYMHRFDSPRGKKKTLYDNAAHTGKFVWKKDSLISETFPQVLDRMVEEFPDQYAFKYTTLDYTRTYAQFRDDVDDFARALVSLGVRRGSKVAIWATNVPAWFITFWAATKIGAVLVTVNTAYKIHEAEYLLRQSDTHTLVMIDHCLDSNYREIIQTLCPELADAKPGSALHCRKLPFLRNVITVGFRMPGCLTFDEAMDRANMVPREQILRMAAGVRPDDVCNMQYTSGTTGFPKGVMLTHYNVVNDGKCIGDRMDLSTADRMMIQVPMFHCFGMVLALMSCISHGTPFVPIDMFNAKKVMDALVTKNCTAVHGVPTMFIAMLEHPDFDKYDFSHMRTGIMAGSPCPIKTMYDVSEKMNMHDIVIVFGQTEAAPGCTMTTTEDSLETRCATVGKAFPGVECKIVDPNTGETLPAGEIGEFCARGYNIMKGYYKMPEATAQAIDKDGWLHFGDLAVCDENGYYKVTGRLKDMIIRGGENIYPKELEECLYHNDRIKDVQVIGVPSKKYGEEVCACVILKEGEDMSEEEIKAYYKENVAFFKIPKYVWIMDEFPMTASGKIQKFVLRDMAVEKYSLQSDDSIETA